MDDPGQEVGDGRKFWRQPKTGVDIKEVIQPRMPIRVVVGRMALLVA